MEENLQKQTPSNVLAPFPERQRESRKEEVTELRPHQQVCPSLPSAGRRGLLSSSADGQAAVAEGSPPAGGTGLVTDRDTK